MPTNHNKILLFKQQKKNNLLILPRPAPLLVDGDNQTNQAPVLVQGVVGNNQNNVLVNANNQTSQEFTQVGTNQTGSQYHDETPSKYCGVCNKKSKRMANSPSPRSTCCHMCFKAPI
mmetsp:Transcript_542/g.698  ORF Transcript_542/g.698 Transcript_542/m.698 type:complete len:117 (+) Transcript_542:35-385(+)